MVEAIEEAAASVEAPLGPAGPAELAAAPMVETATRMAERKTAVLSVALWLQLRHQSQDGASSYPEAYCCRSCNLLLQPALPCGGGPFHEVNIEAMKLHKIFNNWAIALNRHIFHLKSFRH
jgi:hypothetical protein